LAKERAVRIEKSRLSLAWELNKSKADPRQAKKTYSGNSGIAPIILNLGNRWSWVISFTPWPVSPARKVPQHPWNKSGGSRSGLGLLEEIKSLNRARIPVLWLEPEVSQFAQLGNHMWWYSQSVSGSWHYEGTIFLLVLSFEITTATGRQPNCSKKILLYYYYILSLCILYVLCAFV